MLTLRALPPTAAGRADGLLSLYRAQLVDRWRWSDRLLAALLGRLGIGTGWSPAELSFLAPDTRAAGLSMADRKGVHRILNPAAFPLAANPLKNKRLFADRAAAHGLPVPPAFDPAAFDPAIGAIETWLGARTAVIVKRNYSSKGEGIEAFARAGDGWRDGDASYSPPELARRLRRALAEGAVVQERMAAHPGLADLSPGALPTLRVMTCRDEADEPEACGAILRLSAGGQRPVDNFNAGNLAVRVDAGRCGPAWHRRGDGAAIVEAHPATGAVIAGRPIPDLDEAVALALRAHRTLGDGFTVIGWDVGLSDRGPVLIEGNWNPGTIIPQLVGGVGIDRTRLGELYRHHLAHVPAARWSAARAVHRDRRPGRGPISR